MKVKKYTASSMTEAMKDIRDELGSDAVILSSKHVYTRGFLGFFRKRNIEVIAAIDPKPEPSQLVVKQKMKRMASPLSTPPDLIQEHNVQSKSKKKEDSADHLLQEIASLKGMIAEMHMASPQDKHYPPLLEPAYAFLIQQEIDVFIRSQIMDHLLEKWHVAKHEVTETEVQEWLRVMLTNEISWITNQQVGFQKKYINIVGPTGVGKTTTLAKIAAEMILKVGQKVAFITTDTYRIAAIDQLKTYAKILNIPIEVAYNLEDFKRAADRFSHYDKVFIDTAGRNFRNEQYVKELENIIDFSQELETCLVLSLTSKQKDMTDIYQQFSLIPIKQVIFTKADETATYGTMINFIQQYKLVPLYITNGQNVPDDIVKATPSNIVDIVLGANNNERSS